MAKEPLATEHILALLEAGPGRIAALVADATPEQLRASAGGGWSAVDALAHLRSCADVWGGCIDAILAEDHPTIRAINPTTWIDRTDYRELEFQPSFAAYAAQRAALLERLKALPGAAWERSATVTGAGRALERTARFYAQWLAEHERSHFKQFKQIAAALRGGR
ncbi:MAG TPA: DinB family protein [Herpetosiphonaceae bacterium]